MIVIFRGSGPPYPAVISRGGGPPYPPMSARAGLIAKTAIVSGPRERTVVSGVDLQYSPAASRGGGAPYPAVISRGGGPLYPSMSARAGLIAKTAIVSGPRERTVVSGVDLQYSPAASRGDGAPYPAVISRGGGPPYPPTVVSWWDPVSPGDIPDPDGLYDPMSRKDASRAPRL